MMGDAPLGVVARRTCPSEVASFRESDPTHPRTPEPCVKRYDGSLLHQSRAAPRSPKVGFPDGAGGGSGGWRRRAVLGQGCRRVRGCAGVCSWGTVQLLDKVADVPVVVPHGCLRGLLPGRALQRVVEQIIDMDGLTVLKTMEVSKLPSRLGSSSLGQGR